MQTAISYIFMELAPAVVQKNERCIHYFVKKFKIIFLEVEQ